MVGEDWGKKPGWGKAERRGNAEEQREEGSSLALGTGALELPPQCLGSSCEFATCSRFWWASCFP